ncbi:MAG: hypothetical protein HUU10_01110 [Bacteroidetes bacterium]|nr:hypothetical protein [Bacteroidota bacterium]
MAISSDSHVLVLFCGDPAYDSRTTKYIRAFGQIQVAIRNGISWSVHSHGRFLSNWIHWSVQTLRQVKDQPPAVLVVMDIFSVPVALLSGLPFFFDCREINAGVHAFRRSPFKRWFWGLMEKLAFRKSIGITTVNHALADHFCRIYSRDTHILLNLPLHTTISGLSGRQMAGLPDQAWVWVYQGAILPGRGIETLIAWIQTRPTDEWLLLIGPAPASLIQQTPQNKIRFTGPLPQERLLEYTSLGNAGLMLIDPSATSYRLSLPNKFFEYLFAGLPVISSRLPVVETILNQYQCGLIAETGADLNLAADQLRKTPDTFIMGTRRACQSFRPEEAVSDLSGWITRQLTLSGLSDILPENNRI